MNFRLDSGPGDAPRSSERVSHEGAGNEKAPWLRSSTWAQTRTTRSEGDWLSLRQLSFDRPNEERLRTPGGSSSGSSGRSVVPGRAPHPAGLDPLPSGDWPWLRTWGWPPQTCGLCHRGPREARGSGSLPLPRWLWATTGGPREALGSGSLPAPSVVLGSWGPASAACKRCGLCSFRTRSLSSVKLKSRIKTRDSNAPSKEPQVTG